MESFELNINEVKKPVNWWQVITAFLVVLVPVSIGMISMAKTQAAHDVRLQLVEKSQYDNQQKVEKEFDKVNIKLDKQDDKMDKQSDKMEKILVEIQNKQNRN